MADYNKLSDSDDSDASDEDYVPNENAARGSEEENSGDNESDVDNETKGPKAKRVCKNKPARELPSRLGALASKGKAKASDDTEKSSVIKTSRVINENPTSSKGFVLPKPTKKGTGTDIFSLLEKTKKSKMSTLEKSRMDWNNFKEAEGINEDLKQHNKGRDGFLDKRDFLERTNMRQYEIEKQLRATKRSAR